MRKHLLFVAYQYAKIGGLEAYSRKLAECLRGAGLSSGEIWSIYETQSELEGVNAPYPIYGLKPENPLLQKLYNRLWILVLAFVLLFWGWRFELIVLNHLYIAPALFLQTVFSKRRKYWICTHGYETWQDWPRFTKRVMRLASKIITVSQFTKRFIKDRIPGADVFILPNSVDCDVFRPMPVEKEAGVKILLTVGRLSKRDQYKGHDLVIQALPEIRRRSGQDVQYWIVGSGDDLPRLQALAQEYQVPQYVKFLGFVPDGVLPGIYSKSDIFVMLSKVEKRGSGKWTGEGFGRVYLEAAACGKPVIASNQGGAAEALVDQVTGFSLDPYSMDQLVDAVTYLLMNPDVADRMGAQGRKFVVDNYSDDVFRKLVNDLVQELDGASKGASCVA